MWNKFNKSIKERLGEFDETSVHEASIDDAEEPFIFHSHEFNNEALFYHAMAENRYLNEVHRPDELVNTHVLLLHGDDHELAKVIGYKRNLDSNFIGWKHSNPTLDSRIPRWKNPRYWLPLTHWPWKSVLKVLIKKGNHTTSLRKLSIIIKIGILLTRLTNIVNAMASMSRSRQVLVGKWNWTGLIVPHLVFHSRTSRNPIPLRLLSKLSKIVLILSQLLTGGSLVISLRNKNVWSNWLNDDYSNQVISLVFASQILSMKPLISTASMETHYVMMQ
jgi:hypothetical protein